MKKIISLLASLLFITGISASNSFDMKVGSAYSDGPQKWGLDITPSYNLGVDKFLAIGIEPGFQWYKFSQYGSSDTSSVLPGATDSGYNVYNIPLMAVARLRFDINPSLEVAINGGVGYTWTWLQGGPSSVNEELQGIAFQGSLTTAYRLGGGGGEWSSGSSSNIGIIGEIGYRLSEPKFLSNDKVAIMSGIFARVGIRYYMGGSTSDNSSW